jgi:hypothetical protein
MIKVILNPNCFIGPIDNPICPFIFLLWVGLKQKSRPFPLLYWQMLASAECELIHACMQQEALRKKGRKREITWLGGSLLAG